MTIISLLAWQILATFVAVKYRVIFSVFFVFVLMAPLSIASITMMCENNDEVELCENSENSEKERRESESKEDIDEVEEFTVFSDYHINSRIKNNYLIASDLGVISSVSHDVLTPPPEVV